MAVGDVVSSVAAIAAAANLSFQPAAGVEVLITHCGSDLEVEGLPAVRVKLGDTTIVSYGTAASPPAAFTNYRPQLIPLRLFTNNTNYLKVFNLSTATGYSLSYCGIQTK